MKHSFYTELNWSLDQSLILGNRQSQKSHMIHVDGKHDLAVSAAKAFKGDPSLYNPEDMLLSSLTSCHMMSFLYVCNQQQIEVLHYKDKSEAILVVHADGSGQITAVHLFPEVTLLDNTKNNLLEDLHQQAHKLCFIANSCNFPIHIHPMRQI